MTAPTTRTLDSIVVPYFGQRPGYPVGTSQHVGKTRIDRTQHEPLPRTRRPCRSQCWALGLEWSPRAPGKGASRFRYLSLKSPSSAVMTRGRMAAVACRQSRRPRHVVAFSASSMVAWPRVAIGRMGLTVLALAAPLITITTIHRQGSRCPTVRLAQVPPNPAIPPLASDEMNRGEPAGCPTPRG